jgi:D-lyxose ketol-isomerase
MTAASQLNAARARAATLFAQAGVPLLSPDQIDVADFGLGDLEHTGAAIVVHVNTDRYCAKEIAAFPRQTIPQHRHPPIGSDPGKEETFFCRWGMIWLYVEGEPTAQPQARVPQGSEAYFTVFHEITLRPGEQYTVAPNTLHWFQAGDEGAVVAEFSSISRDAYDVFTDPRVRRQPAAEERS